MTDDDQIPNGWVDYCDRHVRIDTGYYEVVVRDDRADLGELEEAAYRAMSEAESAVERLREETDSGGMHR